MRLFLLMLNFISPQMIRWQWFAKILFLLVLIAGTVWILRRSSTATYYHTKGKIFGTFYSVKYKSAHVLDSLILAELQRVDESLSIFNDSSVISAINRNETDIADSLLCDVINLSLQISKATHGAFDITVAPLVNLWGFGFAAKQEVTEQQVDSIRTFVGQELVRLSGCKVQKADKRVMLDCGAVAKGYGVDCVARMLEAHGIHDYLVEIGGEVSACGINAEGKPWTVGVQRPEEGASPTEARLQTILHLKKGALATSGNYRNFYYHNGQRIAHTIDPRTGHPVQHSLLSATVLAPNCATADAFATAFMVLDLDNSRKLVAKHPELEAYLIYDDHGTLRVWKSTGITNLEAR